MFNIVKRLSTHSGRLERWAGREQIEAISAGMRDWYGPDIAVGVPGGVYARKGGDFAGRIDGGQFAGLNDMCARQSQLIMGAGFSSLANMIQRRRKEGKYTHFPFQKNSLTAGAARKAVTHWANGALPAAGATGAAAPGGTACTEATTGAFAQLVTPPSGERQYFVGGRVSHEAQGSPQTALLLYDRLFSVDKTMSSTATEAVTGVPTRYQSTTTGAEDSAEGNFLIVEILGALGAGAHNWTVCTYLDQAGGAQTIPSFAGQSSAGAGNCDYPAERWFVNLDPASTGIQALTQMQCDASITGTVAFTIGHPIGFLLAPANGWLWNVSDAVLGALQLSRIFDNACLALLELLRQGGNGGANIKGHFETVWG